MITLVKISVLTDDEVLPQDFKEVVVKALQAIAADDPEGAKHAQITLEWRQAVNNRGYMKSLTTKMGSEQIRPLPKPKKVRVAR